VDIKLLRRRKSVGWSENWRSPGRSATF